MKLKPALATLLIGIALYFGLPLLAPVPSAQTFKGTVAPAKTAAVTPKAETPTTAQQPAAALSASEIAANSSQEAKRRADWLRGLHLLAIFITTILGIILKPLPMGAVAILGIAVTAVSGTLPIADALSGFSDVVIWLIVLAFFISRGFIKTGLGSRIAYNFMALLGQAHAGPQLWPGRHRPGPRPRHSQQHRPRWRHRHAHHGQPLARLWQHGGRRHRAQDRQLSHPHRLPGQLHHQRHVPHRHGRQPAGAEAGRRPQDQHHLGRLGAGRHRPRPAQPDHRTVGYLQALSARGQGDAQRRADGPPEARRAGPRLRQGVHDARRLCSCSWCCGSSPSSSAT